MRLRFSHFCGGGVTHRPVLSHAHWTSFIWWVNTVWSSSSTIILNTVARLQRHVDSLCRLDLETDFKKNTRYELQVLKCSAELQVEMLHCVSTGVRTSNVSQSRSSGVSTWCPLTSAVTLSSQLTTARSISATTGERA